MCVQEQADIAIKQIDLPSHGTPTGKTRDIAALWGTFVQYLLRRHIMDPITKLGKLL